jgi:DNA-binding transcriptional LysR family regulator
MPKIVAEIDSVSMLRAAVLAGIGVTINPRSSWTNKMEDGPVREPRHRFSMHLSYWLSRSPSPTTAAKAVCSVLEKIVAESAPVAQSGDQTARPPTP